MECHYRMGKLEEVWALSLRVSNTETNPYRMQSEGCYGLTIVDEKL